MAALRGSPMTRLHGIEVEQVAMNRWTPGGRMKLGRLLHVTFKWLPQPPHESGTATYLTSGVSRDVYKINDKVCKFTEMKKAQHTNIPEMGSASDLRELVPACYGHFTVTVARKDVSVLVTALVPETVAELFARLKMEPLTVAGGSSSEELAPCRR